MTRRRYRVRYRCGLAGACRRSGRARTAWETERACDLAWQHAPHHPPDRRLDVLGGIGRHAFAFFGFVIPLVRGRKALGSVVTDDPDELIRAFDTPCARERESKLAPERVDATDPRVEECVHRTRADPIVTKLVFQFDGRLASRSG